MLRMKHVFFIKPNKCVANKNCIALYIIKCRSFLRYVLTDIKQQSHIKPTE